MRIYANGFAPEHEVGEAATRGLRRDERPRDRMRYYFYYNNL